MKKFMKMCGIDFLISLLAFFFSVYAWSDYHLGVFFDQESAIFGCLSFYSVLSFFNALLGLVKWVKDRKSSAAADDNK